MTASLQILSDQMVYLYAEKKMRLKGPFRLIKTRSLQTNEHIWFVTNVEDVITAAVITEIYKHRREIEIFFKFLKQYFHVKHFLSYGENRLQVVMYMSMIAAILVLNYKRNNNSEGYKIAKYRFAEEPDLEIIREIVEICGGDPAKSPLFSSS